MPNSALKPFLFKPKILSVSAAHCINKEYTTHDGIRLAALLRVAPAREDQLGMAVRNPIAPQGVQSHQR